THPGRRGRLGLGPCERGLAGQRSAAASRRRSAAAGSPGTAHRQWRMVGARLQSRGAAAAAGRTDRPAAAISARGASGLPGRARPGRVPHRAGQIGASRVTVAVIGAGPAGLMAAEVLSQGGQQVRVFDAMPSAGRKFLLAGKGGLNLTHSEAFDAFASRYSERRPQIEPLLKDFDAQALRAWAQGLGIATFVGTSGRVFPADLKAAPLLRAWLQRLRTASVQFHMRHRFLGWTEDGALRLQTPQGEQAVRCDAVVLALGGASWPRLGSDGAWVPLLEQRGVDVAPLAPANCGFDVRGGWSEYFSSRFAGQPFK